MGVRIYDPNEEKPLVVSEPVKPAIQDPVKELVQPQVQQMEELAVLPLVQPPEAPQDVITSTIETKPILDTSKEIKLPILIKPTIFDNLEKTAQELDNNLEKGTPKLNFINKIVEGSKHWAAMLLYFGCGLVVGAMISAVTMTNIPCSISNIN